MQTITQTNIKNEGLKAAFKCHNGLMLQSDLNSLTNDVYKLQLNPYSYKFINAKNECVEIDFNGEIINSSIPLPSQFTNNAKNRINRTNEMFSKLNMN